MSENTKKFSSFSRVSEGPVDVVGLQSGNNIIAKLTTDLVETNPDVTFRDAKGRFRSTEDYEELTNQLKVNRFIANELDALNGAVDEIGEKGYDDTEIRQEIDDLNEKVDVSQLSQDEKIATNEEGIAKNKGDIAFLQTHIDANTEGVKKNKNDIAYLQTSIDANTEGVEKNKGDILVLAEDIKDNTAAIESEAQARAADDRQLQAEIEELALILGTIANSIESGYYEYVGNSIPTKAGQFSLTFPDVTTAENIVTFNEVDADGTTHNLPSTVDADDYLEIVDQEHPEQFGLWQVIAEPDGTGIFSVQVKLVKAGENFDLNDRCEARFFSVTDALDVNELDARYLQIKDADFVSKTGGDDMQGPFHVKGHSGDSRGTSRIRTLGVFSGSGDALRLGTTSDRIYVEDENTKFNGGVLVNNIGPKTEDGRGVTLNVEGSNDKHLVTKKYVDDAVQSGVDGIDFPETDISGLVPLDGSKTMTGALTAPRVNVKTTDYGDGVLLVEGKRDNTNNVAARVTFSNSTNANAYGSLEWFATNGSNGTFKFTNKVKLLEEGAADNDAVTKKYVDDKVQAGVDGIELPDVDDTTDTRGRVFMGTFTLKTSSGQPSQAAEEDQLTLWHINPSDASTNPANEFKCRPAYGASGLGTDGFVDLVDEMYEKSGLIIWHFVQGDKSIRMVGEEKGWTSPSTTYHCSGNEYSGDVLTADQPVELFMEVDTNFLTRRFDDYARLDKLNKFTERQRIFMPELDDIAFSINKGTPTASSTKFTILADGTVKTWQTEFTDDQHMVTKKYVDDKVASGGSGFTPGDQVAKVGSSSNNTGAFWIQDGALYCKVS